MAIQSGLLVARGGYWGSLRAALNPLFHTKALEGYGGVMNACSEHHWWGLCALRCAAHVASADCPGFSRPLNPH